MLFQGEHVPRQAARGLMWLTLARDCAGAEDAWIKPTLRDAFRQVDAMNERCAGLSGRLAKGRRE